MVLIETSVFTRQVERLLEEEEYRFLQIELIQRPTAGAVIRGTGGLRKLRWRTTSRGKRGGARVIYYWIGERDTILLLLIYGKGEQEGLTPEQRKMLMRVVEEELKHG